MYTHSHTVSTKVLHVSTTHDPMYHSCSHEATQAEQNISSEKDSLVCIAFTLAKYAITYTGESRANLLCSVYPHFQKHFHRCWRFSWFLCSVTLRGIRDIQILIYAHACLYTMHFFYTPICTHTCMCSHAHAYVHTHAQYTLGSYLNSPLWQDSI